VEFIIRRFAMSRLNLLGAWNGGLGKFFAGNSAQSFMRTGLTAMAAAGSCGSSCGAGDGGKKKEEPKPGTSCGAGDDKPNPKPSACGAGDDKPKPSACGSSCGAGDDKGKPEK
jgi:ACGX-repeat protein